MLGYLNPLQLHGLNLKCMSNNPYFPSQSTSIFAVIEEIRGFLANIHLFLFIFPISIKTFVAQSTLKFVQNRHGPSRMVDLCCSAELRWRSSQPRPSAARSSASGWWRPCRARPSAGRSPGRQGGESHGPTWGLGDPPIVGKIVNMDPWIGWNIINIGIL